MDYPHLERLGRAECRQLLPSAPVGRLAVPTPHFPTFEPVSFAVVEGELVVAVRAGSAGEAVTAGTSVAFEADVLDHALHQGWSVVVGGPVEDVDDDVAAYVRPLLRPWPAAEGDRLLLVRSERISGQRIVTGPDAASDGDAPAVGQTASAPIRRAIQTDEAVSLLQRGGQQVGRLVITVGGEPVVFPLNFAVDGDAVVFRTQVGTKLAGITRSMVTFEVDAIDGSGQGWAVAFDGLAQEVLDADPAALRSRLAALTLDTWPGGDRPHLVRITPYRVYGTAWTPAEVRGTAGVAAGSAAAPAQQIQR